MSRGKSKRTLMLIEEARRILKEIEPASVRAVCYQLFVRKLIENMAKSATNAVSRFLSDARKAGVIPWAWIVDESREAEVANRWSSPSAIIAAAVRGYRRDHWQDQPNRVEVWSEKGTVRGTLGPVLDEYGVTFRVMHGFTSSTVVHNVEVLSNSVNKPLIALYVGDWDPSGLYIDHVDLPSRLQELGAASVRLRRVALTHKDLAKLPSFSVETKRKDPRYKWFKKNYGSRCYELDALPPPVLRARVQKEIRRYIDLSVWEHAKFIEQVEVDSMQDFHKSWQASICSGAKP